MQRMKCLKKAEKMNNQLKLTQGMTEGKEMNSIDDVQKPVGKFAQFTDGVWREVTNGSPGVPLYTHPPVTSDMRESQIESAAKKLAEVMEYPWDYMPEQGKTTMRKNAVAVIEAALAKFK